MTELLVPLPEPLKEFVESETTSGGFANPVDFVQDLIRRAYRDKARQNLETKLLEGLDAIDRGEATEMKAEDWARLRSEYKKKHSRRNGT